MLAPATERRGAKRRARLGRGVAGFDGACAQSFAFSTKRAAVGAATIADRVGWNGERPARNDRRTRVNVRVTRRTRDRLIQAIRTAMIRRRKTCELSRSRLD